MHSQDYDHIVLLAHGSTDPHWKIPFEALQTMIEKKYGLDKTTLAFMELTEPTLESVINGLSAKVKKVAVLPLFLAVGRHLRHDVPEQIKQLSKKHMSIDLLPPIGDDELLQNAILEIVAKQLGE